MTSKSTPGPWSRNIRAGGKYPTVFADRNQHVAVVCQQAKPEETEANIDLVAAAPTMFKALEAVDAEWTSFWPKGPDVKETSDKVFAIDDRTAEIWRMIRVALAEAKGETP